MDDLKISHREAVVVKEAIKEIEEVYGKMTMNHSDNHEYVGMYFEYLRDEKTVVFTMENHIEEALENFPGDTTKVVSTPAAVHLFEVDENCVTLIKKDRGIFHSIVAKLLFVSKRSKSDILVNVSYLTDKDDWKKLKRLLQYLRSTVKLKMTLSADSMSSKKWWVDTSYGVHNVIRSHTGGCMMIERGALFSKSSKQKLKLKNSTKAELIVASEVLSQILWTRYFLGDQKYVKRNNDLFQDDQNAIQMEKNGRASSGKRTIHINIRYFLSSTE